MIDENIIEEARMELEGGPYPADWPIAVEWAIGYLRETGQLIEWHPYPGTKPDKEENYLVTKGGVVDMSFFHYGRFCAEGVTAWAHLPAPAQNNKP